MFDGQTLKRKSIIEEGKKGKGDENSEKDKCEFEFKFCNFQGMYSLIWETLEFYSILLDLFPVLFIYLFIFVIWSYIWMAEVGTPRRLL